MNDAAPLNPLPPSASRSRFTRRFVARAVTQASCPGPNARRSANHVDVAATGEGRRRTCLVRGRRVDQGLVM